MKLKINGEEMTSKHQVFQTSFKSLLITASVLAIASCGGGGGSSSSGGLGGGTNQPPSFTGATDFTFSENQNVIFELAVTDPDSSTVTITVPATGDGSFFILNTGGGVINGGPFDFENPQDSNNDNVYTQTVTVSDGTNNVSQTINVTITNVDEPPACLTVPTVDFNENSTGPIYNLSAAAADPEGDGITGFNIESVSRSTNVSDETLEAFSVDSATGDVLLSPALDAELVGLEGEFTVQTQIFFGANSVSCSVNFAIQDVPGVVREGVKLTGEIASSANVGDIDGDGLSDFVVSPKVFDDDGNEQTEGYLIYGSRIKTELDVDGAEELQLSELIDLNEATKLFATYISPNNNNQIIFQSLGDLDGDGESEMVAVLSPFDYNAFDDTLPFGYVLWGDYLSSNPSVEIDLENLTPVQGLKIFGEANANRMNMRATNGDFDGDGTVDLLIGSSFIEADINISTFETGTAYLVFGDAIVGAKGSGVISIPATTSDQAVKLTNINAFGYHENLASLGDIDGDGTDEIITAGGSSDLIILGSVIKAARNNTARVIIGDIPDSEKIMFGANTAIYPRSRGDVDGDGDDDFLSYAPPFGFSEGLAALAFADGILDNEDGDRIFLRRDRPEHDTVILDFSSPLGTATAYVMADFVGDIDGDGQDEIAIVAQFIDNGVGAVYLVKGSSTDAVLNNTFDLETLSAAQGLKIINESTDYYDYDISKLDDVDGDDIPDILLSGLNQAGQALIIPGKNLRAAMIAGDNEYYLQANFNDESDP